MCCYESTFQQRTDKEGNLFSFNTPMLCFIIVPWCPLFRYFPLYARKPSPSKVSFVLYTVTVQGLLHLLQVRGWCTRPSICQTSRTTPPTGPSTWSSTTRLVSPRTLAWPAPRLTAPTSLRSPAAILAMSIHLIPFLCCVHYSLNPVPARVRYACTWGRAC